MFKFNSALFILATSWRGTHIRLSPMFFRNESLRLSQQRTGSLNLKFAIHDLIGHLIENSETLRRPPTFISDTQTNQAKYFVDIS